MASATSTDHLCEELLKLLECPICLETMEAPILQNGCGHSYCSTCISHISVCAVCKKRISKPAVRNYALEHMSQQVRLTCQKRVHKCRLSISNIPPVKMYECPMSQDTRVNCTWKGSYNDLLDHAKTIHPSVTHKLEFRGYSYPYSFQDDYIHDIGMFYLQDSVFVVCNHYDKYERTWWKVVQVLGSPEHASNFQYEITFYAEDHSRKLTYTRKVHSEEQDIHTIIQKRECFTIHECEIEHYLLLGHHTKCLHQWELKQLTND